MRRMSSSGPGCIRTRTARRALAVALLAAAVSPAHARQAQSSEAFDQDASSDIVVVARRSGAPIWQVRSGAGTVLLVGEIDEVPKTSAWRPERLEDATSSADRVILGVSTKATAGDVLRILFKGARLARLPDGRTADEYLDNRQLRRLEALEDRYDQDYGRQSFLLTAHDILTKRLGLGQHTTYTATDIVRRAAKRAGLRTQPVGTMRAKAVLDDLFSAPPVAHIPCLEAAFDAAEAGPESVEERGRAWSSSDVVELTMNPVEIAIGRYFPGVRTRSVRRSGSSGATPFAR